MFNLKTTVTGGSLLLPLPLPITFFFICCSVFSQATQHKCQCVPTGTEYVMLFHSKLAPVSIGSYFTKEKNHAHIYTRAISAPLWNLWEKIKRARDVRVFLKVALDKETEVSALQNKILNREEDELLHNS